MIKAAIVATVFAVALATDASEPVPMGHPDYYPSVARPYGWRGDGTGAWPGATPVTTCREGTPVQGKVLGWGKDGVRARQKGLVLGDRKSKNIVWKVEMPGFGNGQPIVVGDRVFTMADPHWLLCLDVHTGKVLWSRENRTPDIMGLPEQEADELCTYLDQLHVLNATFRPLIGGYGRGPDNATTQSAQHWLRLAESAEAILQAMNRGPYAHRVQTSLELIDPVLERVSSVNAKDEPGCINKNMQMMWTEAAMWISETYGYYPLMKHDGYTGWTFPAPISDGEFVYAAMGQGRAVCYDLTGNLIWARHFPHKNGRMYNTRGSCMGEEHLPAPILIGDILVVHITNNPRDSDCLAGLDRRTGKTVWITKDDGLVGGCRSPNRLAIPRPDGSILHALGLACGAVLRGADGKVLARTGIKRPGGPGAVGCCDIAVGNRWYIMGVGGTTALQLSATKDDAVAIKELWKANVDHNSTTPSISGGYLFRYSGGNAVVDLRDGSVSLPEQGLDRKSTKSFGRLAGYISPIVAGSYMVTYHGNARISPRFAFFYAADISNPTKPKMVGGKNILDFDAFPNAPRFEQHMPQHDEHPIRDLWGGVPNHLGYGSMAANANRLFIRSVSHLYCIGDPTKPYGWNPASRPKSITDKLETAAAALTQRDPVDALSSPYEWDREQGREAIAALPAAKQKEVAERVGALTTGKGWHALCAANATLRDLQANAAPALPALQKAVQQWIDAGNTYRALEALSTIQAIDPAARKAVVPHLVKALGSADTNVLFAACRAAAAVGKDAEPAVAGLVKVLGHKNDRLATESAIALRTLGITDAAAVSALAAALKRESRWLVVASLEALAARGKAAKPVIPAVTACLKRTDVRILIPAIELLSAMGDAAKPAMPALYGTLKHTDMRVVTASASALHALGGGGEKQLVTAMIKNSAAEDAVAKGNLRALGKLGPALKNKVCRMDTVQALLKALKTRSPELKREAAISLGELGKIAKDAIPDLKDAIFAGKCTFHATRALNKIAPGMKVSKKVQPSGGIGLDADDEDDLGLDL